VRNEQINYFLGAVMCRLIHPNLVAIPGLWEQKNKTKNWGELIGVSIVIRSLNPSGKQSQFSSDYIYKEWNGVNGSRNELGRMFIFQKKEESSEAILRSRFAFVNSNLYLYSKFL